jgi:phosphatidylethanolamine/phosphatidyl-N-methylethanolamine N-methyltransferase
MNVMNPISRDNVIRTYRFYAPFYDRIFGAVLDPGRRALAEAVTAMRPESMLEVGVGTGLTLHRYPPATAIVGIDISAEMLDVARSRTDHLPRHDIRLAAMDAEAMQLPEGAFDCVTVPYVLSVTPNPERLIAEVRRVCKKGGTILVLNHFSGSRFWWFLERAVQPIAHRIGFRSDFDFADHILNQDWEVRSVKTVNLFGLSRLVEIRNN